MRIFCQVSCSLFLVLCLLVGVAFGAGPVEIEMSEKAAKASSRLWGRDFVRAPTPQLRDFENILADEKIVTMSDFLSKLPATYLANYTLMYKSRSLQAATHEKPRAIVYGGDAQTVITFNGDESQRGGNTIEIMEYLRPGAQPTRTPTAITGAPANADSPPNLAAKAGRFYFHEIVFQPGARPTLLKNASRCATCHRAGEEARPVWDGYAFWPGAFGSFDDHFNTFERQKRPQAPLFAAREKFDEIVNAEVVGLKSWFEKKSSHPRYQHLGTVKVYEKGVALEAKPKAPAYEKENFMYYPFCLSGGNCDYGYDYGSTSSKVFTEEDILLRPNLRLTIRLAKLQADRLARDILATGKAVNERDIRNCSSNDQLRAELQTQINELMVRRRARAGLVNSLFAVPDGTEARKEHHTEIGNFNMRIKDVTTAPYELISFSRARCYSDAFGFSPDQWSLAFEKNSPLTQPGNVSFAAYVEQTLKNLLKTKP